LALPLRRSAASEREFLNLGSLFSLLYQLNFVKNDTMKPLLILLVTFAIAVFAIKIISKEYDLALSARIALSIMLLFTAVAHFTFTKGMMLMMPDFIPYKKGVVYFTGIIEILAAIGLLITNLQALTGWLLILFFIMLLPANIHAAIKHVDYQKGSFDGDGPNYLWFRIPLQIFFIVWTYISLIRF
jgi:uncharacterized membrane protein